MLVTDIIVPRKLRRTEPITESLMLPLVIKQALCNMYKLFRKDTSLAVFHKLLIYVFLEMLKVWLVIILLWSDLLDRYRTL